MWNCGRSKRLEGFQEDSEKDSYQNREASSHVWGNREESAWYLQSHTGSQWDSWIWNSDLLVFFLPCTGERMSALMSSLSEHLSSNWEALPKSVLHKRLWVENYGTLSGFSHHIFLQVRVMHQNLFNRVFTGVSNSLKQTQTKPCLDPLPNPESAHSGM